MQMHAYIRPFWHVLNFKLFRAYISISNAAPNYRELIHAMWVILKLWRNFQLDICVYNHYAHEQFSIFIYNFIFTKDSFNCKCDITHSDILVQKRPINETLLEHVIPILKRCLYRKLIIVYFERLVSDIAFNR